LLIAVVGSLSYGVFEEIGWRGFLLPRLQAHMTAIRASGWVFVIWALWHLPMFAYQLPRGLVAIAWIVGLYYGSVWLAMLHNGTAGSVLACIVWHAGYNVAVTAGAELSPLVPAVVTTMVVIATIVAVRRVGTEDLGTRGRFMIAAHTSAAGAARS
jgi:membrane protease YdiL (CAAX protease family)